MTRLAADGDMASLLAAARREPLSTTAQKTFTDLLFNSIYCNQI
jgi:hypothetical protein